MLKHKRELFRPNDICKCSKIFPFISFTLPHPHFNCGYIWKLTPKWETNLYIHYLRMLLYKINFSDPRVFEENKVNIKFLACKNMAPPPLCVAPSYLGNHNWTNFSLHYLRILSHKANMFEYFLTKLIICFW